MFKQKSANCIVIYCESFHVLDVEMAFGSSSASSSESDVESQTMRTEKNISISSTPKFKPFAATVKVDQKDRGTVIKFLVIAFELSNMK